MRCTRIVVLAAATLTVAMLAIAAPSASADGATGVAVQPLTPKPGDVITVKGDLLGPNSEVEVRIIGLEVDIDLGEVQADEEGDFTAEFTVPAELTPGTYQIRATGAESATTQITVTGGGTAEPGAMAAEPELRSRPLSEAIPLIALFSVLAGLGTFFAHFTRRTVEHA